MKRLIDEEKLLDYILSEENKRADPVQWDRYAEITSRQLTAYDVDKVVARLNEIRKEILDDTVYDVISMNHCMKYCDLMIEAVKEGWLNE